MKRGEIWILAGGGDFVGRPRPVVVIQDDRFELESVTVCPLTTNPTGAPLFRVDLQATPGNGLGVLSRTMADKITTVRRTRLRSRVGELSRQDMARLERAILVFLGFASEPPASPPQAEPAEDS